MDPIGFEMSDRAADRTTGNDDVKEETSFINPNSDIWEVPDAMPSWADSSVPFGISQEDLADTQQTEALIDRWQIERGEVQANLEFASTAKGELWLRWGSKWLLLTHISKPGEFLAALTLKKYYGIDVTKALGVHESTGLSRQVDAALSGVNQRLGEEAAAIDTPSPGFENTTLTDTPHVADRAIESTETAAAVLGGELTHEQSAALASINDPPLDVQWVGQARWELKGLSQAMTRKRDELVNSIAKLSVLEQDIGKKKDHLALERRKLTETDYEGLQQEIRGRITALEKELANMQLEREARLEAASANREDLRSQINRVRVTINRVLEGDKTLAERIRTLFREQGVTVASILTAIGMTISTLVLALTGGGGTVSPPPTPPGKGGLREWAKKMLRALGRVLAKLAGKAAAALPGIIGSIVSWLLGALGKTAGWLAGNLWAVLVAVGGLLIVAAREWLSKEPKRH